jgi:uncharacterized protein
MRAPAVPVLFAVAALLAGCVSLKRSPESRYFVLRSLAGPPAEAPGGAAPGLVGLLPVRVPAHLERPQLVTWRGPAEVTIDEHARWAEPVDDGLTRALRENLEALLPGSAVLGHPWPAAARPACRVRVEISLFGPRESGEVRLEGRFLVLPARDERPLVSEPVTLARNPAPPAPDGRRPFPDPAAAVESMSALVADLASQIAAALRALPDASPEGRGGEGSPPPQSASRR